MWEKGDTLTDIVACFQGQNPQWRSRQPSIHCIRFTSGCFLWASAAGSTIMVKCKCQHPDRLSTPRYYLATSCFKTHTILFSFRSMCKVYSRFFCLLVCLCWADLSKQFPVTKSCLCNAICHKVLVTPWGVVLSRFPPYVSISKTIKYNNNNVASTQVSMTS